MGFWACGRYQRNLFVRREDAERFFEDVRGDDEELTGTLQLEPVDLDA